MPKESSGFSLLLLGATVLAACILYAYHHHVLRPWETVTVDYRRLSDAKLAQLAERAMAGRSASVDELKQFIELLQGTIRTKANGRPIFAAGTLLNPTRDLTDEVAEELGIDLSRKLEMTLPGMANRLQRQVTQNMETSPLGIPDKQ